MSVPMGTVTPGEPAVTFSWCRLMIRRADLSVAAAAAGGGGVTEKLQAGKRNTPKRQTDNQRRGHRRAGRPISEQQPKH